VEEYRLQDIDAQINLNHHNSNSNPIPKFDKSSTDSSKSKKPQISKMIQDEIEDDNFIIKNQNIGTTVNN